MGWVLEESGPRGSRLQDAGFSLDTQVILNPASRSQQADQRLGFVNVQLIYNKDPLGIRIKL